MHRSSGLARRLLSAIALLGTAVIALAVIVKLGDAPFLDSFEIQCHDYLQRPQKLLDADWSWAPLGLRCVATSPADGETDVREGSWLLTLLLVVPLGLLISAGAALACRTNT